MSVLERIPASCTAQRIGEHVPDAGILDYRILS